MRRVQISETQQCKCCLVGFDEWESALLIWVRKLVFTVSIHFKAEPKIIQRPSEEGVYL